MKTGKKKQNKTMKGHKERKIKSNIGERKKF